MPEGRIEIITGRERRRRWSPAEKAAIVAESEEAGARIIAVAARHDLCPSLLYTWRRQFRERRVLPQERAGFMPVRLLTAPEEETAPAVVSARAGAAIEVLLAGGDRLHVGHNASPVLLRAVIAALRR